MARKIEIIDMVKICWMGLVLGLCSCTPKQVAISDLRINPVESYLGERLRTTELLVNSRRSDIQGVFKELSPDSLWTSDENDNLVYSDSEFDGGSRLDTICYVLRLLDNQEGAMKEPTPIVSFGECAWDSTRGIPEKIKLSLLLPYDTSKFKLVFREYWQDELMYLDTVKLRDGMDRYSLEIDKHFKRGEDYVYTAHLYKKWRNQWNVVSLSQRDM